MSAPVALHRKRLPGDAGRLRSFALLAATSWHADRARVIGTLATTLNDQLMQVLAIYCTKAIVDGVTAGDRGKTVTWALVLGTSVAVSYACNALAVSLSSGLRERTAMAFEARMVALLASLPGIDHFERPDLLDRVELIRQERWALGSIVSSTLNFLTLLVQVGGTMIVLAAVSPWLLLLPIAGLAPVSTATRADKLYKRAEDETAEPNRLAVRLQGKALEPAAAAELRLHALGPVLLDDHREAYDQVIAARRRVAVRTGFLTFGGDAALVAGQMAAIVLVVNRAASGATTPGDVVLTVALALRLRYQVMWAVGGLNWLLGNLRTVGRLAWLIDEVARVKPAAADTVPVPERIGDGIRFEGVTFAYPGTDVVVLKGVDLFLPAGSTVAVVGENGAGKTTIVKLLCRFYDPTAGQITVDGIDMRQFGYPDWRARLSGAFQDHARLEFLARETVGVGALEAVDDEDEVLAAIERAGASAVLASLPGGLATQLGTRFEDGVELSGGQWQQLALGRGMMRAPGAPLLLLLDEPTAALDPGTEHGLFERYAALARSASAVSGAVTVLVSHRFSTVRMADLIVVVDGGRIVESGTHDELVAAGRLYAELYGLQARAYQA